MKLNIGGLDIYIIFVYMLIILYVGLWCRKKVKNSDDYFVASRSLGTLVIAATVCASILGGSAMIGRGGIMYSSGLVGIMLGLPYLLGMYIFSAMSGRIQGIGAKYNIKSIPELMEYRFGRKARLLIAGLISFAMMATVASQLAAFATVLRTVTGVSFEIGVWIALFIIVGYTSVSGLFGVVYTDVLQFLVLISSVYLILPILSVEKIGGLKVLFESVPADHLKMNITPDIIGIIFTTLIFTFAGAEMWQRAFSSKSPKVARRGMFIGNTVYAGTIFVTLILSLSAVVLFPDVVEVYGTADAALPALIVGVLPTGLLGLAISGIIAVIMSTADTYLLISTQTFVVDFMEPLMSRELSQKEELRYSKIFTVIGGIVAVIIALYVEGVYNVLMFAWTFYAASVGIPAVLALFWKKATAGGIIWGTLAGFFGSIAWKFLGTPLGMSEVLVGTGLCILCSVGISLLENKKNKCSRFPTC